MWTHVMCSSLYGGQWCGFTLCVVRYTEASGVVSRYV